MMTPWMKCLPVVGLLIGVVGVVAHAADPPPADVPSPIAETQVTLRLNPILGRATVIAIADSTLTIVTAAHVLSSEAVGRTILIQQPPQGRLAGRVVAVARNPGFHPVRSRNPREPSVDGTLGVDTAIVDIAVEQRDESDRRAFARIKVAGLTAQALPGRPDQIFPVRIVDQFGEEHSVRVGNHLNPKCLAWGRRSYDTKPGDSGAGVFIVRKTPGGDSVPILIGVVSQTDERGAFASLVHRDEPWLVGVLARTPERPK
jgi:hypothetical protein